MGKKTFNNFSGKDALENVGDLEVFGDIDAFKLLFKVASNEEGWMKSTKAMEIPDVGCIVQITTQQDDDVAEAVTFVPGVKIIEDEESGGRKLVKLL